MYIKLTLITKIARNKNVISNRIVDSVIAIKIRIQLNATALKELTIRKNRT